MKQNLKKTTLQLKQALLKRRAALLATLRSELNSLNEKGERDVGDQLDSALDTEYSEVCSQLAECESRELENIQGALQRLARGKYGVCEECEAKIPVARLRALPYASLCVNCQHKEDRRGGPSFGGGARFQFDFGHDNSHEENASIG